MSHTTQTSSNEKVFPEDMHLQCAEATHNNVPTFSAEEESKLYRKIDLRLLPILSLLYLFSIMDRTNIGNAKLEGLMTQLNMSSGDYTVALMIFFIPYCLFEPASNLVIKRFRPSRYLPFLSFVWGVVMTLTGVVKTYPQLVGIRVCLAVVEAGLFPGVVYFLTFWYPRHMLQLRIGIFFGAATIAGAFSGLLAYGISFMAGTQGLKGWSWIFILEGIATVVVAILSAFVLHGCDTPETASFLNPKERVFIFDRRRFGSGTVAEDDSYKLEYVIKAATDWQLWLSLLIYYSMAVPLGASALFLPSIINGFGYSIATSQLLTVPVFIFAAIVLLTFAYYSDKYKVRSPFIFAGECMALVGFIINIVDAPRGAKFFGMFLAVAGSYSCVPGVVAWLGSNLAPTYKRGVGIAMQVGIGNLAVIITTMVYRAKDEPRYILGHAVTIGFLTIGLIAIPTMAAIYKRINASRDAVAREDGYDKYSGEELARMGDKAPNFRYLM